MPVKHLTDATLRAFADEPPPQGTQIDYFDDPAKGGTRGLLVKHSYGGTLTFYLMYYLKGGKSKQRKLGRYPALKLAAARSQALVLQAELEKDNEYFEKKRQAEIDAENEAKAKLVTLSAVVEKFKKFHIEKQGLRTGKVMIQQINKHLIPKFGNREFRTIKRSEIVELLDDIESAHGASMAHAVFLIFRSIATFHAARDDDFNSPFVKKMGRYKTQKRKRVLNDDEIRAFWRATAKLDTFGALARVCLLTGARRTKVQLMRWKDIREGIWYLGLEKNEKPNCGVVKLTPVVRSIIEQQPRLEGNPFVFPAMYKLGPFNAFGQFQGKLMTLMRKEIPGMPSHSLHDLRRTFRTRLSKLKIEPHIAERCMGHVVGNAVERAYDLFEYFDEKTAAFGALSAHIQEIVTPRAGNVVKMIRRKPLVRERLERA
ncbi:integrase arm-type DNA-binding domain-containing protein [Bradyrhizobium sp. Arg62]|uniref:tyrosine-type recombinase/integrase n=1 Tax=Bradyrhizobium brasilense TaxID=1419277 RepID=UPI001E41F4E2|nr:integrase family protein [Bradyrhizobium brasilense]MCC8946470.1 integrase arm-type DNA-binding domain-containing protein [Bradyrhizobium brasilense]